MARGHAVSGAAVWLGLSALAGPLLDLHPTLLQVVAGAIVASGFALAPDIDHPSSTVARALGPISRIIARAVSWISDAVRDGTCGCCATDGSHGHRTLTHTALFAVASGVGISAAGWRWGLAAAAVVVGVAAGLAALALLPRARRGDRSVRWLTAVLAGAGVWAGVHWLAPAGEWWWLGVPAGVGVLLHSLGDALTETAAPLAWPVRIRGCRWYGLGPPKVLRFRTGGRVEGLVTVLLAVGGGLAGWVLVAG